MVTCNNWSNAKFYTTCSSIVCASCLHYSYRLYTWLLRLSLLQMLRNSFQVSLIFKRKFDFLGLFCIFIIKLMVHKKIVWILLFKYITDQGNSDFSNSVSGRLPRSPRSGQHFGPSQPQTGSVKSWNDRVSFLWPENCKY